MRDADKKACADCPWRLSNKGRKPDHWYARENLDRLWEGLRTGEAPGMSCHPTDPSNEKVEGVKRAPEEMEPRECAGSLLLIQRELNRAQERCRGKSHEEQGRVLREYAADASRHGLSDQGLIWWTTLRQLPPIIGGAGMASMPAIDEDGDIGFEGVEEPQ